MDWMWIEGALGQVANVFVGLPLIGFAVMFGGHVVGNLFDEPTTTNWHKYGLLFGLGFVTYAVVSAQTVIPLT